MTNRKWPTVYVLLIATNRAFNISTPALKVKQCQLKNVRSVEMLFEFIIMSVLLVRTRKVSSQTLMQENMK